MDEQLAALHWAIRHMPPSEQVKQANQASQDLHGRLVADGYRSMSRDEARLERRYESISDSYRAQVLEAYRTR